MTNNKKINLLLVEDNAITLLGLKTALSKNDFVANIFDAPTTSKALNYIEKEHINIVIIGLKLANINGIELIKNIKRISSYTKIILLTSNDNPEKVIEALQNGANAYCSKEINTTILNNVIEHVQYGAMWLDSSICDTVVNCLNLQNTVNEKNLESYHFTTREKEILKLLVNGLDNAQMAKKLSVSLYTIKAHICNILQKLNVKDRTQAAIKILNLSK